MYKRQANDGPAETKNEEQASSNQEHTTAAGGAGAGARRAVSALGECGDCLACGMEKAVALATPPLQHLSRLVKLQVEAGVEACARAHQAAVKAVDNVPQAPGELCNTCTYLVLVGDETINSAFRVFVRTRCTRRRRVLVYSFT